MGLRLRRRSSGRVAVYAIWRSEGNTSAAKAAGETTTTKIGEMVSMTALSGMKDICKHMGKSESTILNFIRDFKFPAVKITGKIWESDTDLIDQWRKSLIVNGVPEPVLDPTPPHARKKHGIRRRK